MRNGSYRFLLGRISAADVTEFPLSPTRSGVSLSIFPCSLLRAMRGWGNRLAGRHYPAAGIVRLRRRNVEVIFLTGGFARSGII